MTICACGNLILSGKTTLGIVCTTLLQSDVFPSGRSAETSGTVKAREVSSRVKSLFMMDFDIHRNVHPEFIPYEQTVRLQ
jgi:hypothetical protein